MTDDDISVGSIVDNHVCVGSRQVQGVLEKFRQGVERGGEERTTSDVWVVLGALKRFENKPGARTKRVHVSLEL